MAASGTGVAVDGQDRAGRLGCRQPQAQRAVAAAEVEHRPDLAVAVRASQRSRCLVPASTPAAREHALEHVELHRDAVLLEGDRAPVQRAVLVRWAQRARRRAAASPKSGDGGEDAVERHPGLGDVAGPLVEVAEHVEEAQLVGLADGLDAASRRLDLPDGSTQLALVGQRAGEHDAPLGHQLGRRRHLAQLAPQVLDLRVAPEGAVAVGQDRVLLGGRGALAEHLELLGRLGPLAQPVEGEPEQLAHGGRLRRPLHELGQDAAGVEEALGLEGPAGVGEPAGQLRRRWRPRPRA